MCQGLKGRSLKAPVKSPVKSKRGEADLAGVAQ